MEWLILSILRALFTSGKEAFSKLSLLHDNSSISLAAFYIRIVPAIVLTPLIFFDGSWESILNNQFTLAIVGNVILNTIGFLLLLHTINRFEVSYVSAILGATPIVFGVFSIIFLGQNPGWKVFLAMLLIVIGAVFIELSRDKFRGFKNFLLNSGWLPLLIYSCIAAGATVFSKIAVTNGDPEAYVAYRSAALTIIFIIIFLLYESEWKHSLLSSNKSPTTFHLNIHAMIAGFFLMCAVIAEMNALRFTDIARVEAITKLAIVFTLFIDAVYISKKISWRRWLGVVLILLGGLGVAIF